MSKDLTPRYNVGDRVDARNGRGWTYDCTICGHVIDRRKIYYLVETEDGQRRRFCEDSIRPVRPGLPTVGVKKQPWQ